MVGITPSLLSAGHVTPTHPLDTDAPLHLNNLYNIHTYTLTPTHRHTLHTLHTDTSHTPYTQQSLDLHPRPGHRGGQRVFHYPGGSGVVVVGM